jgi:hypothetical protein
MNESILEYMIMCERENEEHNEFFHVNGLLTSYVVRFTNHIDNVHDWKYELETWAVY